MVVSYFVAPSAAASGLFDVEFTVTAHSHALIFAMRNVVAGSSTAVDVTAAPNVELDPVTDSLKRVSHPAGLLLDGVEDCTRSAKPAWSSAAADATRSGVHEVVVRLPAMHVIGGARVIVRGVELV